MADLTAGPERQERREPLEIEKLRVEVNKIIAETAKINREVDPLLRVQVEKIISETAKINREVGWYPFVVGGGVATALLAAGAAFTRLLMG